MEIQAYSFQHISRHLTELIQRLTPDFTGRGLVRIRKVAEVYHLAENEWHALHFAFLQTQILQSEDESLLPIFTDVIRLLENLVDNPSSPRPPFPFELPATGFKNDAIYVRGIITEWERESEKILFVPEDHPGVTLWLMQKNDLAFALEHIKLPVPVCVTGLKWTRKDEYEASQIIVLPDLLIQVTQLTTFYPGKWPIIMDIIPQFFPNEIKMPSILGNAVNRMLDMKIRQPELSAEELILDIFKSDPLTLALYDDGQIRKFVQDLKLHLKHLENSLNTEFPAEEIKPENCVIEPSFFSPRLGLQGRLDLYQYPTENCRGKIVELKSGKPFLRPGERVNEEHLRQAVLYDILVGSTVNNPGENDCFIVYSQLEKNALRKAEVKKNEFDHLISLRNRYAVLEYILTKLDEDQYINLFSSLSMDWADEAVKYRQGNYREWIRQFLGLRKEEQLYFISFVAFISREHMISRIGSGDSDRSGGVARLWLDNANTKEDRFEILRSLSLDQVQNEKNRTVILLCRTDATSPMANFRSGDIVVVYPVGNDLDPTQNQLLRGSITYINNTSVGIRLRDAQIDVNRIKVHTNWNVEADLLESSFRKLHQFNWKIMTADVRERNILLGLTRPPLPDRSGDIEVPQFLDTSQIEVYKEGVFASRLYFLWGPPGTGKTSIMMKAWVWESMKKKNPQKVLLLAYTNRAVDEICEMLNTIEDVKGKYIRIGSHDSTATEFQDALLDIQMQPLKNRKQIRELIDRTNVFVGTIHSIMGKPALLELVDFDLMIIDEASQLLEPMVTGLMTVANKCILIGDHKQLPAVSQQPNADTRIREGKNWAKSFQITDLKMSYFERMYRLYKSRQWDYAIGELHRQGRMHKDIMSMVNTQMYNGTLACFDHPKFEKSIQSYFSNEQSKLLAGRVLHIGVSGSSESIYSKVNLAEVDKVLYCLDFWIKLIQKEGLKWSIGVITPFRAQIAAIYSRGFEAGLDMTGITVDTVERYQGGAKDIVILSSVVQHREALSRITSPDQEGLDRKLNVAITRAREQFILIGNAEVLENEKLYKELIARSIHIDIPTAYLAET